MIRPVVVVRVRNILTRVTRDVFALLDSGSDRDVICESLVRSLNVPTTTRAMTVKTINSTETRRHTLASFGIASIDEEYEASIEDAMVSDLTTSVSDVPPVQRDSSQWPHLKDLQFASTEGRVQLIVGVAHGASMFGREIRMGTNSQPIGVNTAFGWTILGTSGKTRSGSFASHAICTSNLELSQNFDRIFHHDFPPVSDEEMGESRENREAIRQIEESIRFDEELGKYVVALPSVFSYFAEEAR